MRHVVTALATLTVLSACADGPTAPTLPTGLLDVEPAFSLAGSLISNGGFESGITGWTVDAGDVDVVGPTTWAPSEGARSLDLNGFHPATISQPIATVPGVTYTVLFDLAGNPGAPQNVKKLEVSAAGGSATYEFDTTGKSGTAMGWREESFAFTATGPSTLLVFKSLHAPTQHPNRAQGPALDNIRVFAPADASPPIITSNVSGTLGDNGWYTSDVSVTWTITDAESDISSTSGCDPVTVSSDTDGVTFTCTATSAGGTDSAPVTIRRDATPPAIAFSGNEGSYAVDQTVDITCEASDATSGLASSDCPGASGQAYTFGLGNTALEASATDNAGNRSSLSTEFTVSVTSESLCSLVRQWVTQRGVANALCQQLSQGRNGPRSFINTVRAQTGRHVPAEYAPILIHLAGAL